MFSTNCSHAIENGGQNGIHNRRRVTILYEYVDNMLMNILVTQSNFILIITWSSAYSCGQQRNWRDKKCRQIDDNFNNHADAVVRCGAHRPMKHNQGFTRSQLMPPSGECSHCIAVVATIVKDFEYNTNKTQLLASNYGTFRALVVCENFTPQNGPSTQSSMRQAA